jgi:hypothetical protein
VWRHQPARPRAFNPWTQSSAPTQARELLKGSLSGTMRSGTWHR